MNRPKLGGHKRDDHRLAELEMWVISSLASTLLMDLEPFENCRVVGVVEKVRLDPQGGWIEATVTDGTGWVGARWPIRRSQSHLHELHGRAVALEGFSVLDENGDLLVDDPRCEAVPPPDYLRVG